MATAFLVLAAAYYSPVIAANGQTAEPNRPIIGVDRDVYELGELATNSTATAEFRLTNTGNAELQITNVGKCCGASVELSANSILPGQSATLKVIYNTGLESGEFRKELYVYSNDPARQALRLTITGKVKQYLVWEPAYLWLFLNKPNLGCPEIRLKALDGKPFAITGQLCVGDCITVEYDPNYQATEFVLRPKVDRQRLLALEYPKGTFQLRLTRPDYPTLGLPFDVIPNYVLNPSQLYLTNGEPGKPMAKKVQVLDNYVDVNVADANFVIASVTSAKGISRLLNTRKIRSGYEMEVEVTPPPLQSGLQSFSDELTIKIKDYEEDLTLYVRGFYAPKVLMNRPIQ